MAYGRASLVYTVPELASGASAELWVILAGKGGVWGEGSQISTFLVSSIELAPV